MRILLIIFLALMYSGVPGSTPDETGEQGVINLTSFAFENGDVAALEGPWEFYWRHLLEPADFQKPETLPEKTLITLPALWKGNADDRESISNTGYATYRLQVTTSSSDDFLALNIPEFYSSYKIWINGKLKTTCGKVGNNSENTIHRRKGAILPFKTAKGEKTEIIIQVANFYHKNGGIGKAPAIGHIGVLMKREASAAISETMLSTSLILMGLAFVFLFSLWRKDKAVLYFGLFCLLWAYRTISENHAPLVDLIPFISWEINARLEYIALFSGSLTGCLYFNQIFQKKGHPSYKKVIIWIISLFSVATLFSPDTWFTYYLQPFFLIMVVNFIYITTIVILSMIDKNPASWYAIAGIALGVVVFISHMVVFYNQTDHYITYINLGYLTFFFLSATMLGVRFSRAFFKLEILQKQTFEQKEELKAQADMLKVVNDQIIHQKELLEEKNQEIRSINKYLEDTVSERTSSLRKTNKELDLFLYRASHDLRRPISSIMGIDQIAKMTVNEKEALDLFKKVESVVQSMDMMLKKFISISEIYNHQIRFSDIDMNTLKGIISNQALFYAGLSRIENYHLDVDGPVSIFSDLFVINKITTYLIENSFMFSQSLEGDVLKIKIAFEDTGSLLRLHFSDNGDGIKKEIIDKIFNMYFVGTIKSNGNGLGLYIVKKAAEKLGEQISVESKSGIGTTFHLTLNKNS